MSVHPDASRAIRATVAFMVPLALALTGSLPVNVSFTAVTAQNLAMVDVRGDYRFRIALLAAMGAVFVGAAALGTVVAHQLGAAIAGTILVVLCGSVWRHLSTDYGAGLAISSSFVFLLGLASPDEPSPVTGHVVATLTGAAWAILVQLAAWPLRPQHPLRRAVSDSWIAVAELFDALASPPSGDGAERHQLLVAREGALRATLDAANAALAAKRKTTVRSRLDALNQAAARLAMRVAALDAALESLTGVSRVAAVTPALDPALTSLSNLCRSVAVAVVSRQPADLVTCEVRLRRVSALLAVVRTRFALHAQDVVAAAQLAAALGQVEAHLPAIHEALRATIARADERFALSLELRDLRMLALRPLGSALNLTPKVDPALVRFTLRLAVLAVVGVIAFERLGLPHGYWIPFTAIVVLQPDYGSTRQRAFQRMLGTLGGSVIASALLWLQPPHAVVLAACAATIFIFGFWVKRNYGIAVVFITLFVVLLTEATGPVSFALAAERLGSTLAGGLLAMLAAHLFWPVWERERMPPILAAALRVNGAYFQVLMDRVIDGGGFDAAALAAKRGAERASSAAFSSLNRLHADPKNQREGLEDAAALANGNQRTLRALNVLAVHLQPGPSWQHEALVRFRRTALQAFDSIARAIETNNLDPETPATLLRSLESDPLPLAPAGDLRAHWAFTQLTRVATELSALLLTIQAKPGKGTPV